MATAVAVAVAVVSPVEFHYLFLMPVVEGYAVYVRRGGVASILINLTHIRGEKVVLEYISIQTDGGMSTYDFVTLMSLMHYGYSFSISSDRGVSNATITTIGFNGILRPKQGGVIIITIENPDAVFTPRRKYLCALHFDKTTVEVRFVATEPVHS